MNELEEAIKWYCEMLPYPNTGANPNDDPRLYKISYFSLKLDITVTEELLCEYLKKYNKHFENLNNEDIAEFANNRLKEIENGRYVLSNLQDVLK